MKYKNRTGEGDEGSAREGTNVRSATRRVTDPRIEIRVSEIRSELEKMGFEWSLSNAAEAASVSEESTANSSRKRFVQHLCDVLARHSAEMFRLK